MKTKKMIKNEKGFTLIEIIAVIIIMGILAAVAVPKFFSMQEDAKIAALNGALSEAAARFNHAFSKYILVEKKAPADINGVLDTATYLGANADDCTVAATGGEDIGDFRVCWVKGPGADELTITVVYADTIGATALAAMAAQYKTKVINGVNWGT
jgi:prepilin-type N-terminal cleavage/methylation domain-containing protein